MRASACQKIDIYLNPKKPRDVFAQALLLIKNLDALAKAADGFMAS